MYFGISFGTLVDAIMISLAIGFGIGVGLVLFVKRKK